MAHPVVHHTKKVLNKPHLVVPTAIGIALIIGVAGYFSQSTSKHYQTTPADLGAVTSILSTSGTVKAATETALAFPKGGRVNMISVKVGQHVYRGQTLASLDSNNAQGAVETAQGAYQIAQANYSRLVNGASSSDLTIAKLNYDTTVSEQALAVKTAHQKLLSSDLVAVSTGSNTVTPPIISGTYTGDSEGTITMQIYGTGGGGYFSTSGIVQATGTLNAQSAQPIGASGLYILFPLSNSSLYATTTWTIDIPNTKGSNYTTNNAAYTTALQTQADKVAQAKAALDKVQAAPRNEDLTAAEAQVSSALGALHTAQASLANDFITAPIDGVITSIGDISAGSIVSANTPVIGLMSEGAFQIDSYISEKDLALVSPGEAVTIVTDAYGPSVPFKGTVISLAPAATTQANGQLGYKVTFQFSDMDTRVKPGLSATVTIEGGSKTNVLRVPRTALFLKNGTSFVLLKNGSKTEERPVTTGLIGNDNVEILTGVVVGEQVVTLGQN